MMNINGDVVSEEISVREDEDFCLGNCSDCDLTSSFCELINRRPICQCKKGYVKIANG